MREGEGEEGKDNVDRPPTSLRSHYGVVNDSFLVINGVAALLCFRCFALDF